MAGPAQAAAAALQLPRQLQQPRQAEQPSSARRPHPFLQKGMQPCVRGRHGPGPGGGHLEKGGFRGVDAAAGQKRGGGQGVLPPRQVLRRAVVIQRQQRHRRGETRLIIPHFRISSGSWFCLFQG